MDLEHLRRALPALDRLRSAGIKAGRGSEEWRCYCAQLILDAGLGLGPAIGVQDTFIKRHSGVSISGILTMRAQCEADRRAHISASKVPKSSGATGGVPGSAPDGATVESILAWQQELMAMGDYNERLTAPPGEENSAETKSNHTKSSLMVQLKAARDACARLFLIQDSLSHSVSVLQKSALGKAIALECACFLVRRLTMQLDYVTNERKAQRAQQLTRLRAKKMSRHGNKQRARITDILSHGVPSIPGSLAAYVPIESLMPTSRQGSAAKNRHLLRRASKLTKSPQSKPIAGLRKSKECRDRERSKDTSPSVPIKGASVGGEDAIT